MYRSLLVQKLQKFSGTSISACIQIIQRRPFFSDDSGWHSAIFTGLSAFCGTVLRPLYLSNRSNECTSQQRTLYQKQTILPFERIKRFKRIITFIYVRLN